MTPNSPANGDAVTSPDGLTVLYTCNKGFTLDGVREQYCTEDGTEWSAAAPTCGMTIKNLLLINISTMSTSYQHLSFQVSTEVGWTRSNT